MPVPSKSWLIIIAFVFAASASFGAFQENEIEVEYVKASASSYGKAIRKAKKKAVKKALKGYGDISEDAREDIFDNVDDYILSQEIIKKKNSDGETEIVVSFVFSGAKFERKRSKTAKDVVRKMGRPKIVFAIIPRVAEDKDLTDEFLDNLQGVLNRSFAKHFNKAGFLSEDVDAVHAEVAKVKRGKGYSKGDHAKMIKNVKKMAQKRNVSFVCTGQALIDSVTRNRRSGMYEASVSFHGSIINTNTDESVPFAISGVAGNLKKRSSIMDAYEIAAAKIANEQAINSLMKSWAAQAEQGREYRIQICYGDDVSFKKKIYKALKRDEDGNKRGKILRFADKPGLNIFEVVYQSKLTEDDLMEIAMDLDADFARRESLLIFAPMPEEGDERSPCITSSR